jgi:CheY-like chemotaxis protein
VNRPQRQNQILFVDDERAFLETVTALFSDWSKNTWQIHRADSADQALEILKTQKIDLIVVDANMPVLDGVQFIRILNRRHPELKKAVLTGFATEEKRSACLSNGVELFIEKPRSADGLKSVFVMLDELMTWAPREGFQGMLRRVGLQDVIQMECLGRNSSILEIYNLRLRGFIYIEDGNIVHAVVGGMTGEKALQKLLAVPGGSFQLLPFEKPPQRTVEGPWEYLLMEAARMRDEMAAQTSDEAQSPAAVEPAATSETINAIAETLICSGKGEPLYVWQCPDTDARVALLQNVGQQAALIAQTLPLGNFDRLEIQLAGGRAVAQTRADRLVFVGISNNNRNT